MDADNKQATVMNILVAHENMDEKTAYNIVKTIFDKRDDLIAVHKEAANFKLENQKAAATPIPFHPGALKYFAEKGVKLELGRRRGSTAIEAAAPARSPGTPARRAVSDEALRQAEEFIEEEEGAANS